MYIIHPNYGIKMFFKFARVFLSHKFYNKLCLLESIHEFQKIIPPTIISLPLKFLRKEDEDKKIKYSGLMAPLINSFDPKIGTTQVLSVCAEFIKHHNGLKQQGIFRVAGDEGELNLAKVRLQYSNKDGCDAHITLSNDKNYILIGDLPGLAMEENNPEKKKNHEDFPSSVIIVQNVNSVAQIFKMSIRDLPEALIPNDTYQMLIEATRKHEVCDFCNLLCVFSVLFCCHYV
jgi:hypothetical protein